MRDTDCLMLSMHDRLLMHSMWNDQAKKSRLQEACFFYSVNYRLDSNNVLSLGAFLAGSDRKLDLLTFQQRLEA